MMGFRVEFWVVQNEYEMMAQMWCGVPGRHHLGVSWEDCVSRYGREMSFWHCVS